MTLEWPLIGRDEELDLVGVAVGRAGRGVVIAGRAGVGKTRLARAAVRIARERGAQSRLVIGTATGRTIPLGAFGAFVEPGATDLEERMAVTRVALLAGPGPHGVIVLVDDAHLLDPYSATLVNQLVVSGAAKVIVTVRTGEEVPDAVTSLWKDGGLPRLELQALSRSETTAAVEAALGGQLDSAAAARLFEISDGNVLYLRQVVEAELEAGRLALQHSVWRWTGTPKLSPTLAELVGARMGLQAPDIREVMEVLALAEPLPASVLTRLVPPAAVEEAEQRGLASVEVIDGVPMVRSGHPLFAEASAAALGAMRARSLRSRIVEALDVPREEVSDGAMVLRRAILMLDSDMAFDPDLLTRAAEEAALMSDGRLVTRLGRAAVSAGGGFRAQKVVAFHETWAGGDSEVADSALALLEELARTPEERSRAVMMRAAYLAMVAARPQDADVVLRRSADLVATTPMVAAFAALLDAELVRDGAADRARMVLADPGAGDEAVAIASMALAISLTLSGGMSEAEAVVARGIDAASRGAELASFGVAIIAMYVHGLGLSGDVARANEVAAVWKEQLAGHEPAALFGACIDGDAQLSAGRLRHALRALREARSGFEPFGDMGGWRYASLIMITRCLAESGDADAAAVALRDLDAHVHATFVSFEPERLVASAHVAAAEGLFSEAQAISVSAADLAEQRRQWALAAMALESAVRCGGRGLAGRAAALVPRVEGPRAAAAHALASALDAADGTTLLEASRAYEEMGDLLAAGDGAAWAAAEFERGGRVGSALEAKAHVARLSALCDGVRTPVMARADLPLPLTDREREIAAMAAHGMSNKEIAARLVVSGRTVEGHLYRINQKLGTTRRDDLTRLFA